MCKMEKFVYCMYYVICMCVFDFCVFCCFAWYLWCFFFHLLWVFMSIVLCVVSSILCLIRLMCDESLCLMSCVYVVVLLWIICHIYYVLCIWCVSYVFNLDSINSFQDVSQRLDQRWNKGKVASNPKPSNMIKNFCFD
jgi:hypothetical protein